MFATKNLAVRSPLKSKPRRNPGQSLDEEMARIVEEEGLSWAAALMAIVVLAGMEWLQWYLDAPRRPLVFTGVAVGFAALVGFKLFGVRKRVRALKLGRDGERAVGQYLDDLREKGCRIFHDLRGEGFNVDHVIVSRHGVYTVETKTLSKPVGRDARVRFDGARLEVDGRQLDRDPLKQAQAQARWVSDLLTESTGRSYSVRPVIVFPGWYVTSDIRGGSEGAWVLNPRALPAFIEHEPSRISEEDVRLAAYHLSRHARATA